MNITAITGWIGLLALQGASIPSIYLLATSQTQIKPPVYMIALISFGLLMYLVRSILIRDLIFTISNSIGLLLQSILMLLLLTT